MLRSVRNQKDTMVRIWIDKDVEITKVATLIDYKPSLEWSDGREYDCPPHEEELLCDIPTTSMNWRCCQKAYI